MFSPVWMVEEMVAAVKDKVVAVPAVKEEAAETGVQRRQEVESMISDRR